MHDGVAVASATGNVLVVDDFLIERRVAGRLVEQITGLPAIYASDGRSAIEVIARERPTVVLTDVQMPDMDGLELVEAVRERFPTIPVVLMTSHGSEDLAVSALRAGAAGYVRKRSLQAELPDAIGRLLKVSADRTKRRRLIGALRSRESTFSIENDPGLIAPMVELLLEDLDALGIGDATDRMRIGVALAEALTNAIVHGNLEVDSDLRQEDERFYYQEIDRRRPREPYRDRRVHLRVRADRESVTYIIRDEGPGFDTSRLNRPIDPEDLLRVGGRGLLLIRAFMDEVEHNETGNQILMRRRCPALVPSAPEPALA